MGRTRVATGCLSLPAPSADTILEKMQARTLHYFPASNPTTQHTGWTPKPRDLGSGPSFLLGRLPSDSVPRFPHLYNEDGEDNGAHPPGVVTRTQGANTGTVPWPGLHMRLYRINSNLKVTHKPRCSHPPLLPDPFSWPLPPSPVLQPFEFCPCCPLLPHIFTWPVTHLRSLRRYNSVPWGCPWPPLPSGLGELPCPTCPHPSRKHRTSAPRVCFPSGCSCQEAGAVPL